MSKTIVALLLVLGIVSAGTLTQLNVNLSGMTVSGISSGAMMAGQFHIAHSQYVKGSAIVAGGPVGCAQGFMMTATAQCMGDPSLVSLSSVEQTVSSLSSNGSIDALSNVSGSNVYIFAGTQDTVVDPESGHLASQQFTALGANVMTEFSIAAEHSYVSNYATNACNYDGNPYLNNCSYDMAYISLNYILGGNLVQPTSAAIATNLIEFSQSKYNQNSMASLFTRGYVYIPTACQAGGSATCSLHVHFHGCQQSAQNLSTKYIKTIGINDVAEANNIVVLYPQIMTNSLFPFNPEGCWDWWGYSDWSAALAPFGYYTINSAGSNYLSQNGLQIEAVWQMIQDIVSQPVSSASSA